MQLIRKRVKSLGLATVFAVIVGSILSFSLNKPISASAYELHPTGNRAVYDGYTSAPSGNWYSDNLTVSNSPMITVLTHGLMADASTWSNNYNGNPNMSNFGFAYDNSSLIEQLRSNAPEGATVFLAEMRTADTFRLMELPIQGQLTLYSSSLPTISRLEVGDFIKHLIIVFNSTGTSSGGSNAAVYYEFQTMLNRLVRDIAYLTGGIYPLINLIGHSRGGVTNLTYAMDYPRLIHSVYSLGTPYLGSNFGRINAFSEMLGMYGNAGFNDIQNNNPVDDGTTTLMQKWNSGRTSGRYSHINVHAFAGDSSLNFYKQMDSAGYLSGYGGMASDLIMGIGLLDWPIVGDIAKLLIKSGIHDMEDAAGIPRTSSSTIDDVLDNVSSSQMHDDLFVSRDSQHGRYYKFYLIPYFNGYGYVYIPVTIEYMFDGFNKYTKYYENLTDANLYKISQNAPPIVHNLEARDSTIIENIVGIIEIGYWQPFTTNLIGNSELSITGVKSGITLSGVLTIPDFLNGRTVSQIGGSAFSGQNQLTKISIPATVTTIGANAFKNTNNARIDLEGRTSSPSTFNTNWNSSNNPVYFNNVRCYHTSKTLVNINGTTHGEMCDKCRTTTNITSHNYTNYVWKNYNQHSTICGCGSFKLEGHAVSSSDPGFPYKTCLHCGGPAQYGFGQLRGQLPMTTLVPTLFIQEYFGNGSYLLSNGIYVISDEDLDGFYDGTLVLPESCDDCHEHLDCSDCEHYATECLDCNSYNCEDNLAYSNISKTHYILDKKEEIFEFGY